MASVVSQGTSEREVLAMGHFQLLIRPNELPLDTMVCRVECRLGNWGKDLQSFLYDLFSCLSLIIKLMNFYEGPVPDR